MAPSRGPVFIPELETYFLKSSIESGKNFRAKLALQALCKHYWHGRKLFPKHVASFENTVLGALSRGDSDEKVRRWSLSAIAQFGRPDACWTPVLEAIQRNRLEQQVLSSGIAAAYKLMPSVAHAELMRLQFVSPEILAISALQVIPASKLGDMLPKVDVETADVGTLKLALILVGLNKAPANLFDPKYENRALVKALCAHEEPLVSQYAIWATAENPQLSARDLGIDPTTVERYDNDVRSYIYRLFASDLNQSALHREMIEQGSTDYDAKASVLLLTQVS